MTPMWLDVGLKLIGCRPFVWTLTLVFVAAPMTWFGSRFLMLPVATAATASVLGCLFTIIVNELDSHLNGHGR